MRVILTPWAAKAMRPEDREVLDQEREGRTGEILSLLAKSASGPFIAKLYVPDLGDFRGEGRTISAAIVDVIEQVGA